MTSSDDDANRNAMDAREAPDSEGPRATGPGPARGAPQGPEVPSGYAPPGYEAYCVEVDEETQLHLGLWRLGSAGMWARALVVRGTTPPFVAAHEALPHGLRFVARPHGTPAPLQERAVRVEFRSAGHPRIDVEEVWRAPRVLGDGGAG